MMGLDLYYICGSLISICEPPHPINLADPIDWIPWFHSSIPILKEPNVT